MKMEDNKILGGIEERLMAVGVLRDVLHTKLDEKKRLYLALEQEHSELFQDIEHITQSLTRVENDLREEALGEYAKTRNKKLYGGIAIKMFPVLEYDDKEAFRWAVDHKIALALDKRAFTKIAKTTPMDFVTITTEPKATLPTKIMVSENPKNILSRHLCSTCKHDFPVCDGNPIVGLGKGNDNVILCDKYTEVILGH